MPDLYRGILKLTEEEFKDGKMSRCKECPVALAAKKTFEQTPLRNFRAMRNSLYADDIDGRRFRAPLLPYVGEFMKRFDLDITYEPEPFQFEVELTPL